MYVIWTFGWIDIEDKDGKKTCEGKEYIYVVKEDRLTKVVSEISQSDEHIHGMIKIDNKSEIYRMEI